jgi:putative peptidoglycan lipid II flippase
MDHRPPCEGRPSVVRRPSSVVHRPPTTNMQTRKLDNTDRATIVLPDEGPVSGIDGSSSTLAGGSVGAGRRMAANTAIVGGAFIISRVLGLVREAVIAGQFGTSAQYDTYLRAFSIPDTLFLIIIGGAVGSAFIPVFARFMGRGQQAEAWHLTSTLINASVVLLSLLGIVMGLLAPPLVGLVIDPGGNPASQALAVDLTRILLLSPLFLGLGGWAMGILNAQQHFLLPALAPIFYNLAIIGGTLFLAPSMGVYGLTWGVVVGALLHFGVQVPGLVHAGMRYSFRLNLRDAGVGEVGKLILPRIAGQAAFQVNVVAIRSFSSFLAAGALSAFNYAYLLMLLPHGVFAMSLATVTFPTMAAQFAEGKLDALRVTLARAVKVLLFLTIPSAVGLFVLRTEIVATLFQFGRFTSTSTVLVASALSYFAFGLIAYAVVEVITRGFYALHDTRTPVVVSVATVALNLGLAAFLALSLGMSQDGLALSLAITTTLEMILLWALLGRKLPSWGLRSDGMFLSVVRSGAAALAMGVVLWLAIPLLRQLLPASGKLEAAILATAGVALGAAVYLGVAKLLRSEELAQATGLLMGRLRRR